jgi:hypothetical protein
MSNASVASRRTQGEAPAPRSGAQGYLFLHPKLKRARVLAWLRRTHAWCGLWGAALALLFATTGFLLNHRAVLKIPALHTAQATMQLALAAPLPQSADALAQRVQRLLQLEKPAVVVRTEPAARVYWSGTAVRQPPLFRAFFASPQRSFVAEYWQGNTYVTVKQQDPNFFAYLTRLHTGAGASAAWVLLVDTLAGGLIALALSGVLLWSRLHGPRLLALGLMGTCIACAIAAVWLGS